PSPLSLLLELGQAFHSTLELDPLLVTILRQMQSAAQSEDVSIWMLDDSQKRLTCTHAVGPQAKRVTGRSLSPALVLHLGDRKAAADETQPGIIFWGGARSVILARLEGRGALLGTIAVANKVGQPDFSDADRALVTALAGHAAVAIQNARLYEQQ